MNIPHKRMDSREVQGHVWVTEGGRRLQGLKGQKLTLDHLCFGSKLYWYDRDPVVREYISICLRQPKGRRSIRKDCRVNTETRSHCPTMPIPETGSHCPTMLSSLMLEAPVPPC